MTVGTMAAKSNPVWNFLHPDVRLMELAAHEAYPFPRESLKESQKILMAVTRSLPIDAAPLLNSS